MAKKAKIEDVNIQEKIDGMQQELNVPEQENQPQPVGSLFGNIQYYNHDDVPNFFDKMTPNDAIFILLSAARFSQSKGLFSLEESEAVSRAVRLITTPPQTEQAPEQDGGMTQEG